MIYFYVIISPSSFPCSYLCTSSFPWQLPLSLGCIADHSSLFLELSLFFPLQLLKYLVPLSLLVSSPCLQTKSSSFLAAAIVRSYSFFHALPLTPFSSYTLPPHLYKTLPLTRTDLFFPYHLLLHLKFSEGQISPKKKVSYESHKGCTGHFHSNFNINEHFC